MGNLITNIYEAMRTDTKPGETCGELCREISEAYGITFRAVEMRFLKVTGNRFAKNREVTAKEKAAIREAYPIKEKLKRVSQTQHKAGERPAVKASPGNFSRIVKWTAKQWPGFKTAGKANARKSFLIGLMAAPAVASWQNMLHVVGDITQDATATLCFAITFTAAPFVFVLLGMRAWWVGMLTASLILIEVFCNTVRIYGGLTGFGEKGYPTRFLGIVCELLNTGTYGTATFLAAILSLMAASVFYAAYWMVKK